MARTFTLANLRTAAKERADMESTAFIADAEWDRYLSSSYTALYDMLVKAQPDFYMHSETLTGVSGTSDYDLAANYYGTVSIDYFDSGTNTYRELRYIQGTERNDYSYDSGNGPSIGYHFVYNNTTPSDYMVRLLPSPATGESYRHLYIVAPADLTDDADVVDGVAGWEEIIILEAAIKALSKEESPTGALERQLDRIYRRVEEMVENRTMGQAGHVTDARRAADYYWDPSNFWINRP